jgi:hypothetical protein
VSRRRHNSGPLYWKDQKQTSPAGPAQPTGSTTATASGTVVKEVPVVEEASGTAPAAVSAKADPPSAHVSLPSPVCLELGAY